jgi:hypothetical protein
MARPWRGAALVILVAAPALALPAPTAAAAAPAPRVEVSLIGDSVLASIGVTPAARRVLSGMDVSIDAEVCRRTGTAGCRWKGEVPASARDVVAASPGQLGDVVVIASGYNDDARRFPADARALLRSLASEGVQRVVWLDLRTPASLSAANQARQRSINDSLRTLDRASPLLRVASWDAASRGHDRWFTDGLHLRTGGAVELARFIRQQLQGVRPIAALRSERQYAGSRCAASAAYGTRVGRTMTVASATPATPARGRPVTVLDTRPDASDRVARPLARRRQATADTSSAAPVGAKVALVRVSALDPCRAGQLTVAGCGLRAEATVPFVRHRSASATAAVRLGAFGRVCVRTTAQTDVRVEVLGWSSSAVVASRR